MKQWSRLFLSIILILRVEAQALPTSNVNVSIVGTVPSGLTAFSSGQTNSGSTSQLRSILGLSQAYFQSDDISLSNGGVSLREEDLRLPGKNGLDVVIGRSYSSLGYKSEASLSPVDQKQWGMYAGNGWVFNVGMRAYLVQSTDSNQVNKVFIEGSDGIEEYENGVSKRPGNFNRASVKTVDGALQIELRAPDGKTYVYRQRFYTETYSKNNGQYSYIIWGYVLTQIKDDFGNTLSYSYTNLSSEIILDKKKMGHIIGKANVDYIDKNGYVGGAGVTVIIGNYSEVTAGLPKYISKRLASITDTFGRVITFGYGGATNQGSRYLDQMITSVQYYSVNGTLQTITYSYDNNGNLTRVKVGNLPEKSYQYTYFSPRYRLYDIGHSSGLFNHFDHDTYYVGYSRPSWAADPTLDITEDNDSISPKERRGYLLETVTSSLGGAVKYFYEDSFVPTSNSAGQLIDYGGSTPVVIKKVITSTEGMSKEYRDNPPRDSLGYIKKEKYTPPNQDYQAFYFSSITIDNPSEVEDETYTFQNALVTKHTQKSNEELTDWDYGKMLPARVTTKKGGKIQTQVETLTYDPYFNVLERKTKKGDALTDFVKEETNYYTDPAMDIGFINQNLIHLPKTVTVTDLSTNIKRYRFTTYTAQGKPYESYEGADANGRKLVTLTYDSIGRVLTQAQYGPGGTVTMQYSYTLGGSTYTITQTLNGKTGTIVYETNTGSLKSSTDPNGNITTYTYDDYGRPIQVTYPNGQTAQTSYSSNLKTTTVTQGGRTVISTLDSLGRTIQITYPSGEDNVKYEYYYGSLPSKIYKQPGGTGAWVQKKSYTYDTYLRKLSSTSSDFGTTSYSYDDNNNKVTVTDPLGRSSTQTSDELGRQLSQVFNPDGSTTTFTYDRFNNPLTTTDPRSNIHKADFDSYGRITNTYHPYNSGTGKVRSTTVYKPNGAGFIDYVQVYDEQGTAFRKYGYVYDSENRIQNTQLNNVTKETFTYDEASQTNSKGSLTTAENDDSKTQYGYDTMGRLQKTTTTIKAINKTYIIQQSYNPTNGNLASLTYPDNKQVTYTYDSHQRVQTMAYNGTTLCTYAYNPNGTIASLTYGNGITLTYTYTKDILLTNITAKQGTTTLYTQSYTYDTLGKMTNTTHSDYFNSGSNLSRDYTYTQKDELKTVALNNTNLYTHNYDKTGNTLRFETPHNKSLGADNITVSSTKDQLTEKRQKDGKKTTFTYDPEGNMTQKNRLNSDGSISETTQYTYNYQGQLQSINKNNTPIATYAYDHNNQRIYSYHPQDLYPKKFYYWSNGQIISEGVIDTQNASNSTDYSVRYFYSGNQKIAMERRDMSTGQTSLYYFINNAQGTPVLILDNTGGIKSRINLDEWGNLGMLQGPSQEINYTGKKLDTSTGLYYFNQRYYDPEIGRFLQEDPAGQGLNPYRYCGNNPLMYTDPDGEWFFALIIASMIEGAKAAALNVLTQVVTNGFNFQKINGDSVVSSFATAGVGNFAGGLTSKLTGMSFGSGFWNEMGSAAVNRGVGNVIMNGANGNWNVGDNFLGGAQQGAGDFLMARAAGGAQLSIGKEYTETYDSIKRQVEALKPGEGFLVASGGVFGIFEHWQVMYNDSGVGKDFGSLGFKAGSLTQADFEAWTIQKKNEPRKPTDRPEHLRIVRKIANVNRSNSRQVADTIGYNPLFNNCIHAAGVQP